MKGRICRHKVLRINYTTYDMRHDQDSLDPRTHANIMLLAHDNGPHAYWHALDPAVWNRHQPLNGQTGWAARCLHHVGFVPHDVDDPDASPAFGFLDPMKIVRGIHILLSYHNRLDEDSLPPSATARLPHEGDEDYNFYYIMQ